MNNLYYLIAQLPSLEGIGEGDPLPITEERFDGLCEEQLGRRMCLRLGGLTLTPDRDGEEKTGSTLIDAWNERSRELLVTLAQAREAQRGGETEAYGAERISGEARRLAEAVLNAENPLEAERLLTRSRLRMLEELRPADPFAKDQVFYYGLKLKLLLRIGSFDRERGKAVFGELFHTILSRERPGEDGEAYDINNNEEDRNGEEE